MQVQKLLCFICLLLIPNLAAGQNLLVQNNQVDKLFLDDDRLQIYQVYPSAQIKTGHNPYQTEEKAVLEIRIDTENMIIVNLYQDKISKLTAIGSRFITETGIRLGNSLFDLKKTYAGYRIQPAGDDAFPYFISRRRIAFKLSGAVINMTNEPCVGDLVDPFPNSLKVAAIVIW